MALSIAGILFATSVAVAGTESTCVFTISLTSGTDVNNLDYEVDYLATGGNVEGTPNRPECARAVGGLFISHHDEDEESVLKGALVSLDYLSAPTPLVGCRIFYDTIEPTPEDFIIDVLNAGRDGGDNNVIPLPTLAVTDVECPGELPDVTTTTTLAPTTTTLPGAARCGFPLSDGEKPSASDALYILKAAVGGGDCPLCVCDVNDSGSLAAGDSLTVLRAAVGVDVPLTCPPC
ncbi:MAG: hypothetical protein ABR587_16970 [Candidatus Binatia bacterium]